MNYLQHLVFLFSIYMLLVTSLDLMVGHLGRLVLCHSAFYAIGSYCIAILTVDAGVPFPLAVLASIVLGAVFSLPVAFATRRLRGDDVVLVSFGFLLIVLEVLKNWRSLTGGLDGIPGIPPPSIGEIVITSRIGYVGIVLALAVGCWLLMGRLMGSTFGLYAHASREDARIAIGLGIDPTWTTIKTFCLGGGAAALAGSMYASYTSYIDPMIFGPDKSFLLIVMVLLGGAGTRAGPLLGALLLFGVVELLRFVSLGTVNVGLIYQMTAGLLLVGFAMFRPRGIVPGFAFR